MSGSASPWWYVISGVGLTLLALAVMVVGVMIAFVK